MICVCVDYRDINKSCPKDNHPTPFIDQIINDCAVSEIFSLMDGSLAIIRLIFSPQINTRLISFVLGVPLPTEKYLLV